jgi:hypothetical protein
MFSQPKPWHLAAVLALCCAVAIGVLEWRSRVGVGDPARLLEALPLNGAVKGYLDVAKLRDGKVLDELAGNKASEDAEYREFAQQIGFDYRTDLDAIAVAYANGGLYAALRGRFSWQRLSAYAVAQHGQCAKGICSMPASRPNQIISWDRLSDDVLAWAVTDQPLGVAEIGFGKSVESSPVARTAVLWLSAPGSAFKDPEMAPSGSRAFLSPLAVAQDASFSLQLANNDLTGKSGEKFEIRMQATCASPDIAAQLAGVLTKTTDLLRGMIVRDKLTPDQSSLTAVLVSGRFENRSGTVTGAWPMDRRVIEALISGEVR